MKIIEAVECDHCRKVHRIGSGSYIVINGTIEYITDPFKNKGKEKTQIVCEDVVFCLENDLFCFRDHLSDEGID